MKIIRFTPQELEKLKWALDLFITRGCSNQKTTAGLNTFDIVSILGFLVDYGYFANCSFGKGNFGNEVWLIFIRTDMPNIKASWGVYPRICINTKTSQIEVNISISKQKHPNTKEIYTFKHHNQIQNYNAQNTLLCPANPKYDFKAIIDRLEKILNDFLQIQADELMATNKGV